MDSTGTDQGEELYDDEIAAILHAAILAGDRRSRMLDIHLAALSAERLVDALRAAGVRVVRVDR